VAAVTVSARGRVASPESRPTRRWYATGPAKPGTLPADQLKSGVMEASAGPLGARGEMPVGNVALAATSGRPQPRVLSGVARFVAYAASAPRKAIGPRPGWICFTSAADAASRGVANDVPERRRTAPPAASAHPS